MTDMTADPKHARIRWTFWQGAFVLLLCVATLSTAGPAGFSVYQTSRDFARPYLHHEAWILPVALEAVFMVLFGWGIVLAWRKVADVPIRVTGSQAIAALSFAVQIDAGHGVFSAILVRVAVTASFFVAGFTMKAAFMRLRGGKVRGDRVSLGEWLASPARAAGLWRWKNAWAEPSAETARRRYLVLLYVIALAQSDPRVGRQPFRWRRRLPVTLRYQLSTGLLPAAISAGEDGWQDAAAEHVTRQLALLPPLADDATEDATEPASEHDSTAGQHDATGHASHDATEPDSGTPAATPEPRQRPRQPTAAERAKTTARVRRILAANPGLTLAEVAAKAGVSERTVSRIKNAPPERPSLRLAKAEAMP